eukprot:TRINITY_DN6386_c2_g3_i4.p1 TRINITY_DN6386_c2_g3~~TRINITY_DN6386_c2_g3_i4.p1  ORF type:complete len:598 (+),score=34.04 TRINITY_DN6386_c2_g3_i4:33-1796(+)
MLFNTKLSKREIVILVIFTFVPIPFGILAVPCAPEEAKLAFRLTCVVFGAGSCVALFCERAYYIALSLAMFANETAGGIVVLFWCGSEWARRGLICIETAFVFTSLRLFFTSTWNFWHFFYLISVMAVASHISLTSSSDVASAGSHDDSYEDWSVTLIVLVVCLVAGMCAIGYLDPRCITALIRRRSQRRESNVEVIAVSEVVRRATPDAPEAFISITPSNAVPLTRVDECSLEGDDCAHGTQDMCYLNVLDMDEEEDYGILSDDQKAHNAIKSSSYISESSLFSSDTICTMSTTSILDTPVISQGVQTSIAWNGNVLKCSSCSLPPRIKSGFAGKWIMCPYRKDISSNLHVLNIFEGVFLDTDNEAGELIQEDDATYLLGGRICKLANGMLQRETNAEPTLSTYMQISEHLDVGRTSTIHTLTAHALNSPTSNAHTTREERPEVVSQDTLALSTSDAEVQTSCSISYFCVCNHGHIMHFDGWWRALEFEGSTSLSRKALSRLQIQGATIIDRGGTRHMAHEVHGRLLFSQADAVLAPHACGMELVGDDCRIVYKKLANVLDEADTDSSSGEDEDGERRDRICDGSD